MKSFKSFTALLLTMVVAVSAAFTVWAAPEGEADAAGFVVAQLGDNVDMHTDLQTEALADFTEIRDYVQGREPLSAPKGAVISWEYTNGQPESFVIRLSENEDMSDAAEFVYEVGEEQNSGYEYALKNLYLGKTYYYTISDGDNTSDVNQFTTGYIPPRNLEIDSIENVRDLGGWELAGGGRVKQGMMYRTPGIYTFNEGYSMISDLGIQQMNEIMHVKSEIDVRGVEDEETDGQTECPLGGDSQYFSFPLPNPFQMKYEETKYNESLKGIFQVMADEANYPIIYHCAAGTDRTGFITMVVLTLLGVSEDDILRDYVFSSFAGFGSMRDDSNLKGTIKKTIEPYEGDTLSEKSRNFLLDIGLTNEEIDNIVRIMTEE